MLAQRDILKRELRTVLQEKLKQREERCGIWHSEMMQITGLDTQRDRRYCGSKSCYMVR